MEMITDDRCPKCYEGLLRSWQELTGEEQELVKRLPMSAEFTANERESTHRWCSRCWHESNESQAIA